MALRKAALTWRLHAVAKLMALVALATWAAVLAADTGRAAEPTGMRALDDAVDPELTPLYAQAGGAMNKAVELDGVLWLGVGPRLLALDLQQPSDPREIGKSEVLPGVIQDLVIDAEERIAWLAAGAWLIGIDIRQPWQPSEFARAPLPGRAERIVLAADHVWALLDDGRIIGITQAEPTRFEQVVEIPAPEGIRVADISSTEHFLYRLDLDARGEGAPHIAGFDVGQPRRPRAMPSIEIGDDASYSDGNGQMEWQRDQLRVLLGRSLITYREVGGVLVEVGSDALMWGGHAVAMALEDSRAYISFASGWSDNYAVGAFDIADPSNIRPLTDAQWQVGRFPGVFSPAIAVHGSHVWVSSTGGFLTALDLRDASALPLVGAYATVGEIQSIEFGGNRLFALANQSAQVIDIQDPQSAQHRGLLSAGFHYGAVSASGDLAGLAIWGQSDMIYDMLQLVDVQDPRDPQIVYELKPPEPGYFAHALDLHDSLIAFAASDFRRGKVKLFDVTAPASPRLTEDLAIEGIPEAIHLRDGKLLTLIDAFPEVRLQWNRVLAGETVSESQTVLVDDATRRPELLLAASDDHAFVVVSDQDPSAPAGTRLLRNRLLTIDLREPGRPLLLASLDLECGPPCEPRAMIYDDDHVFIASDHTALFGVVIVDVEDAGTPEVVQRYVTRSGARGLAIADDALFVATQSGGLNVFRRPPGGWNVPPAPPTGQPGAPVTPFRVLLPILRRGEVQ